MEYDKLKVVIVDDESAIRDTLTDFLNGIAFVKLEGGAGSVAEALPLIIQTRPDVILLDTDMPCKDGFALLDELNKLELHYHVVFISAYKENAFKAIGYRPFDFMLKPIIPDNLTAALHRVLLHIKDQHHLTGLANNNMNHYYQKKICFKTRSGFMMVELSKIIYVEADWNYSTIFLSNNKQELVTLNIGKIEKMLPSNGFFRVSRSVIINFDYLLKVDRKNKTCILEFNNTEKMFKLPRHRIRDMEIMLNNNK